MEAFTMLVLRYLDGGCTVEEVKQLRDALSTSAPHRELFVNISRMQGDLYEAYAPRRAARQQKAAVAVVPARAVALVGAHEAGAATRGTASGDRNPAGWPEHDEITSDYPLEQGLPAVAPTGAGDTIERELSAEDTAIQPSHKAPEQKPSA